MQDRAIRRCQGQFEHSKRQSLRTRAVTLPSRNGTTADPVHLQRATDALRIGRVDARCGDGIDLCQLLVQTYPAAFGRLALELGTHTRIRRGHLRQATQHGAKIQTCAADQQRQLSTLLCGVHAGARVGREVARRIDLVRITNVDHGMRCPCQRVRIRLRCTDIETAIHQG